MSPFLAVFLVLVLGATSYAAGRLHGQLSYRIGYRFGYRQGYFDGDRGAWNRRRREAQAAIASALAGRARPRPGRRPRGPAGHHVHRLVVLGAGRPGHRAAPDRHPGPAGRLTPRSAGSRSPVDRHHGRGASSAADTHRRGHVRPVTVVPPAGMRAGGMHPGRFRRRPRSPAGPRRSSADL